MHTVDVLVFGNILFNLKVQLLNPISDWHEGESLGKDAKTRAGRLASSAKVKKGKSDCLGAKSSEQQELKAKRAIAPERLEPDMSPTKIIIKD